MLQYRTVSYRHEGLERNVPFSAVHPVSTSQHRAGSEKSERKLLLVYETLAAHTVLCSAACCSSSVFNQHESRLKNTAATESWLRRWDNLTPTTNKCSPFTLLVAVCRRLSTYFSGFGNRRSLFRQIYSIARWLTLLRLSCGGGTINCNPYTSRIFFFF